MQLNHYLVSLSILLVGKWMLPTTKQLKQIFLVKPAVQDHHSGVGYRDGSLQVHTEAPKRKQYQRNNSYFPAKPFS